MLPSYLCLIIYILFTHYLIELQLHHFHFCLQGVPVRNLSVIKRDKEIVKTFGNPLKALWNCGVMYVSHQIARISWIVNHIQKKNGRQMHATKGEVSMLHFYCNYIIFNEIFVCVNTVALMINNILTQTEKVAVREELRNVFRAQQVKPQKNTAKITEGTNIIYIFQIAQV